MISIVVVHAFISSVSDPSCSERVHIRELAIGCLSRQVHVRVPPKRRRAGNTVVERHGVHSETGHDEANHPRHVKGSQHDSQTVTTVLYCERVRPACRQHHTSKFQLCQRCRCPCILVVQHSAVHLAIHSGRLLTPLAQARRTRS